MIELSKRLKKYFDAQHYCYFFFSDNKLRVALKRNLYVHMRHFAKPHVVKIPVDYVSDGMSIPSLVQPLIGEPFEGNTIRAALVHDYLCCKKKANQLFTHGLFRCLLVADGVHPVRAWACWLGVVSFNVLKNYILTHPSQRWKL
jgi:hypothetical protein